MDKKIYFSEKQHKIKQIEELIKYVIKLHGKITCQKLYEYINLHHKREYNIEKSNIYYYCSNLIKTGDLKTITDYYEVYYIIGK